MFNFHHRSDRQVVHRGLFRFNNIAIPSYKFQMANGFIFIFRHILFRHISIYKYIHTISINTNHFTVCENEFFVISNLHFSLTNAALCLVLLPPLSLNNIFLTISS